MEQLIQHLHVAGSLVNSLAIIFGGGIGLLVGKRLPERFSRIVYHALGLATLALAMDMALRFQNFLLVVISLVLGALIGEFLDLESRVTSLGENLKKRFGSSEERFVDGFVTASVLFCTGAMAILGSFEEGLGQFPNLLFTKSFMDGTFSVAFAASMGAGVLFAAVPIFIYQGSLTLFAAKLHAFLTPALIDDLSSVGGILLIGLALSILDLRHYRITNMLPALPLAIVFSFLF